MPFKKARLRNEMLEQPQSVQKGLQDSLWVQEVESAENFVNDRVFSVVLAAPASEEDGRQIVKDPSKFVAKNVAKGVEVSWAKLNETQRSATREAKSLEVNEWIKSKVCCAALGKVDPARIMKMRWVLRKRLELLENK